MDDICICETMESGHEPREGRVRDLRETADTLNTKDQQRLPSHWKHAEIGFCKTMEYYLKRIRRIEVQKGFFGCVHANSC